MAATVSESGTGRRMKKEEVVSLIMEAKRASGKTYAQIANETGLTNVYVAQLLRRQAQLSRRSALALQAAIPGLNSGLVEEMMIPPLRSYDSDIAKDPCIYRLNEAVMHFGESIKDVINEDFGDGIMSAIDFYCSVKKVKDKDGKDRVVITFDGKYLPYAEQFSENMQSIQNQ